MNEVEKIKEESMVMAEMIIFGHQFDHDVRSLNACTSDLEKAFADVCYLQNKDAQQLATDIAVLIKKSRELAHSADEALNQRT